METDILVRTTAADGSVDLRYMTAARPANANSTSTSNDRDLSNIAPEVQYRSPPVTDKFQGIYFYSIF